MKQKKYANKTFENIKKVYSYGKEYKKHLKWLVWSCISGVIAGIIVPLLSAKQIVYLTSNVWEQDIFVSLVIVIVRCYIAFAKCFFWSRHTYYFIKGTTKNLQIAIGKEILKINQADMDKNSSGLFIQRVTNDTEKMSSFFSDTLDCFRKLLANIGCLFATLVIDWRIFLYYLFVSIILTSLHILKTKKFGKKDIEYRNKSENVSSLISELVRGVKDIKMLNSQKSFITTLEKNIEAQNQKRFEMLNITSMYSYIINTLTAIFELGLIVLLILFINNGTLTIALALALFNYKSGIMTTIMEKISTFLELLKTFDNSCDRVFSILDDNEFSKESFGNKHLEKVDGNIEFKDVSFEYNKNMLVLDGVNFKIRAGEMVGFVGKSGAGKTTIFNLLCKLYQIKSGKIFIENEEINNLDRDSIRGNITIINQDPYIFNLSIRDNLKLVKEDLTEEEMVKACKIACLDEFIESLPNKYDTVVGENGVILSGGQKQRLAIARAFVQKTKIILFDEATSSLDNETQSEIKQAIANLKNEYTILIIAHRLSTIINCDKIMMIENGKIDDIGTHEELLNRNNTYRNLYQTEILK